MEFGKKIKWILYCFSVDGSVLGLNSHLIRKNLYVFFSPSLVFLLILISNAGNLYQHTNNHDFGGPFFTCLSTVVSLVSIQPQWNLDTNLVCRH